MAQLIIIDHFIQRELNTTCITSFKVAEKYLSPLPGGRCMWRCRRYRFGDPSISVNFASAQFGVLAQFRGFEGQMD
jgi:hypothetical protein